MEPTHRITTHPGEMVWEEFLIPLWPGRSRQWIATEEAARVVFKYGHLPTLASDFRWLNIHLYDLSVLDAIVLADRFGNSEQFWLNLMLSHLKTKHKLNSTGAPSWRSGD